MPVTFPRDRARARAARGALWVAGTNNHAVRVVDLRTHEVRALTLSGL